MTTHCTTAKGSPTYLYLYLRYFYPVSPCEHCATHDLARPLSRSKHKINNLYFSVNNCALHLARRPKKTMLCCLCCLASVYLFESGDILHGKCHIVPGRAFVQILKCIPNINSTIWAAISSKWGYNSTYRGEITPQLYPFIFGHVQKLYMTHLHLGSNLPILLRITSPRYSKPFHCKVGSCKNQAFAGSHTYKASTLTIVGRCRYFEG